MEVGVRVVVWVAVAVGVRVTVGVRVSVGVGVRKVPENLKRTPPCGPPLSPSSRVQT